MGRYGISFLGESVVYEIGWNAQCPLLELLQWRTKNLWSEHLLFSNLLWIYVYWLFVFQYICTSWVSAGLRFCSSVLLYLQVGGNYINKRQFQAFSYDIHIHNRDYFISIQCYDHWPRIIQIRNFILDMHWNSDFFHFCYILLTVFNQKNDQTSPHFKSTW